MGEAIVFTSGKGGVGKTTTIANIGAGLSRLDKKVIMLDTDMGLRNLDVVMGMEDQIQYRPSRKQMPVKTGIDPGQALSESVYDSRSSPLQKDYGL